MGLGFLGVAHHNEKPLENEKQQETGFAERIPRKRRAEMRRVSDKVMYRGFRILRVFGALGFRVQGLQGALGLSGFLV